MASTLSFAVFFSIQQMWDVSGHLQHSKPQKPGMNRAQSLGDASPFIILLRHRILALHWLVPSSLEARHRLESIPSSSRWIAKQANQWSVSGTQLKSSDLRHPFWCPTSTYHLLGCYTVCITDTDRSAVSRGSQLRLSCTNWLSINSLLFTSPLVSLHRDVRRVKAQGSKFWGSRQVPYVDGFSSVIPTAGTISKEHLPGLEQTFPCMPTVLY